MENSNYKDENTETNYLHNKWKNQVLKVKNSLLELEKDLKKNIELKDRELKGREVKIKREMEELLFKLITVSFDDMEKFKRKEMKKKRPIKNTWHDWLINCISEAIRNTGGGFKDKLGSFLKQI